MAAITVALEDSKDRPAPFDVLEESLFRLDSSTLSVDSVSNIKHILSGLTHIVMLFTTGTLQVSTDAIDHVLEVVRQYLELETVHRALQKEIPSIQPIQRVLAYTAKKHSASVCASSSSLPPLVMQVELAVLARLSRALVSSASAASSSPPLGDDVLLHVGYTLRTWAASLVCMFQLLTGPLPPTHSSSKPDGAFCSGNMDKLVTATKSPKVRQAYEEYKMRVSKVTSSRSVDAAPAAASSAPLPMMEKIDSVPVLDEGKVANARRRRR